MDSASAQAKFVEITYIHEIYNDVDTFPYFVVHSFPVELIFFHLHFSANHNQF